MLDTGIDASHPSLAGRVLSGIDLIDGDRRALPRRSPDGRIETHGTRMAGIVAGSPGAEGAGRHRSRRDESCRSACSAGSGWAVTTRSSDGPIRCWPGSSGPSTPTATATSATRRPSRSPPSSSRTHRSRTAPRHGLSRGRGRSERWLSRPQGTTGPRGTGTGRSARPAAPRPLWPWARSTRRAGLPAARVTVEVDGDEVFSETVRALGTVVPRRAGSSSMPERRAARPRAIRCARREQSRRATSAATSSTQPVPASSFERAAIVPADGESVLRKARLATSAGARALLRLRQRPAGRRVAAGGELVDSRRPDSRSTSGAGLVAARAAGLDVTVLDRAGAPRFRTLRAAGLRGSPRRARPSTGRSSPTWSLRESVSRRPMPVRVGTARLGSRPSPARARQRPSWRALPPSSPRCARSSTRRRSQPS